MVDFIATLSSACVILNKNTSLNVSQDAWFLFFSLNEKKI